jgi:hypothetical protein
VIQSPSLDALPGEGQDGDGMLARDAMPAEVFKNKPDEGL